MALRQPFFVRVADGILGGIAGIIRFLEDLLGLLAGPLLTAGLAISLVDLLTDGKLTAVQPELLYTWALSQALGVDAQLVSAWDKARQAIRGHKWLPLIGLVLLGSALGYVAWVSAQVFGLTQAEGITTAQALAQLGFDQTSWLIQRSLLSVFLVALSGFTRYRAPVKVEETAEDERARLERELQLEPLRQRVREVKAVGAVNLTKSVAGAATGKKLTHRKPTPPMGGTPLASQPERAAVKSAPLPTAKERILKLLRQNPNLGKDALAKLANVSPSTAAKHKREWIAEVREAMERAA